MKELEDYAWFPHTLRQFQTAFIGFAVKIFRIYDPFIQYIQQQNGIPKTMWDLCSGSGEPAMYIYTNSNKFSRLILTDKYPVHILTNDPSVIYQQENMDVLKMSYSDECTYTMFNAFHHFTDEEKQKLVTRIGQEQATMYIVEILEPTLYCLIKIVLMTTIGTLLMTPFMKPFSFWRIFFTYILPVNLFTIFVDGVISVFKSRSIKQYQQMLQGNKQVHIKRLRNCIHSITLIEIHPST